MQTKVDERKLVVQHGSDVHQMLNPRLPTQTTTIGQARWSRCKCKVLGYYCRRASS